MAMERRGSSLRQVQIKRLARFVPLLLPLVTMLGASISVGCLLSGAGPAIGSISLGLCGITSPDDLLIAAYLEANADLLEQPAGSDDTPVTFTVQPGETAGAIATRLQEAGLISDAELFRRYAQYHGLDAGIEVGEFTLRQTMTIPEIARALQDGRNPEQVVTIQEGLRLEQVAVVVANQTSIPQDEFLALTTSGWRNAGLAFDFLGNLPHTATLEGFLFPETYRLPEDADAGALLTRMLETFDARVTLDMRAAAAERGLDIYEVVTLASIVEREAVVESERPLIAGVFHNRLESGWFLGADPTVQYGLDDPGNWWPVLTLSDLESDSPYNTYRNLGLPPGPICSPGLASIQATIYPTDSDYFFFLADCIKGDGSHLFAVTQEEHNRNYRMCGGQIP